MDYNASSMTETGMYNMLTVFLILILQLYTINLQRPQQPGNTKYITRYDNNNNEHMKLKLKLKLKLIIKTSKLFLYYKTIITTTFKYASIIIIMPIIPIIIKVTAGNNIYNDTQSN